MCVVENENPVSFNLGRVSLLGLLSISSEDKSSLKGCFNFSHCAAFLSDFLLLSFISTD